MLATDICPDAGVQLTVVSAAAGRPVAYRPVSRREFQAMLAADPGVPAELAAFLADLFGEVLDGRNAATGDGVQRALGRPARDFSAFARAAAAAGVWRVAA